jgi:serine/threonine protein kinase
METPFDGSRPPSSRPSAEPHVLRSRSGYRAPFPTRASKLCLMGDDIVWPIVASALASHGLELRGRVGCGGFGSVFTAWHGGCQQLMAVKVSDIADANWPSELESLKLLYHVNIVKLYDTFEDRHFRYLVLEYCSEGTLRERIEKGGPLCAREFRDVAVQLLEALTCCHGAGIAHLDIKPENVFFHSDGRVRLGDFGCSRAAGTEFVGGSTPYMAPEILSRMENYDKFQADIWSLGVTFYQMACARVPWKGDRSEEMKKEIRLGIIAPLSGVDPKITALISGMMQLDPNRRTRLQDLLETMSDWPGLSTSRGKVAGVLRQLAPLSKSRDWVLGSQSFRGGSMIGLGSGRRSVLPVEIHNGGRSRLRFDEDDEPEHPVRLSSGLRGNG